MSLQRRSFLVSAAAAATAFGQGSGTVAEARKALDAFVSAVKKNDVAAVAKMLADDLVYTHSTGIVESKAEYLEKLKAGTQKYAGIEFSNLKMRTYGNVAVVNTMVRMTGATKGVPFDNMLFLMQVWVKQGADWKLVAHQTTKKP